MIIPQSFKLFGQTIKVKYSRTLMDRKGAYGIADFHKNIIFLQQSTRKTPLAKGVLEQVFVHEATHLMIDKIGYRELAQDEKFIEALSNILLQFIEETKD